MSIRKSDRIISVEHVSKYFGEKAVLNDVNLQVRKGEFVTILAFRLRKDYPVAFDSRLPDGLRGRYHDVREGDYADAAA